MMQKWVCVCRSGDPNHVFKAEKFDNYSVRSIRSNIGLEADETLLIRTPAFMVALGDDEVPVSTYPQLIMDEKPDDYGAPQFSLVTGIKLANSALFFVKVVSEWKYALPAIHVLLTDEQMDSSTFELMVEQISNGLGVAVTVDELSADDQRVEFTDKLNSRIIYREKMPLFTAKLTLPPASEHKLSERVNVIREVLSTEESYLSDLNTMVMFWRKEMSSRGIISEQEAATIFLDIPEIISKHTVFLEEAQKVCDMYYCAEIGTLFVRFADVLSVAKRNISEYRNRAALIEEKKQTKTFATVINELRNSCNGRDLSSFLVTTVQRIPRYAMFIKKLISCTPLCHPDVTMLPIALDAIKKLNELVDLATKEVESRWLLMQLQTRMKRYMMSAPNIVNETSSHVASLEVTISNVETKQTTVEAIIYVCTDRAYFVEEKGRVAKLLFMVDTSAFHYSLIPRTFRTILVESFVKKKDKLARIEWIVAFSDNDIMLEFLSQIDVLAKKQKAAIGEQRSLTWSVDPLSDIVVSVAHHAVVPTDSRKAVVFYGGYSASRKALSSDIFTYSRKEDSSPGACSMTSHCAKFPPRRKHTVTCVNSKLYVIGGIVKPKEDQSVVEYDVVTGLQTKFASRTPIIVYGHTCVAFERKLYVFGGQTKPGTFVNDMVVVDTQSRSVSVDHDSHSSVRPSARSKHTAVVYDKCMFVFGGKGPAGILGDLWSFSFETSKWTALTIVNEPYFKPLLRRHSHLAFCLGREMIIIGGFSPTAAETPTLAIDMDKVSVTKIADIGNVQWSLHGAQGAVMDDNSIVLYGGLPFKHKTPQSTIYTLRPDRQWRVALDYYNDSASVPDALKTKLWDNMLSNACCDVVTSHRSQHVPTATTAKQMRRCGSSAASIPELSRVDHGSSATPAEADPSVVRLDDLPPRRVIVRRPPHVGVSGPVTIRRVVLRRPPQFVNTPCADADADAAPTHRIVLRRPKSTPV